MMYSVIVPAFNAEETIGECLASLLKQSVPRNLYEIIVVDDGSTDSTAEVVKKFDGVKYFYQPNQGPAAARNFGAKEANGDILLFTDSDCVADFRWMEEMLRPFEENEGVVGAKGAYRTKQRDLIARFVQLEYEGRYDLMSKFKHIDFIDTYAAAYKKDVFISSGGFDTSFHCAMTEDTELSYRLSKMGCKMIFNPKAIVYHYHPTSLKKYLKRKFMAAFWRLWAVKKHPDKVTGDTHTPNLIKFQIVSLALLLLAVPIDVFTGFKGVFIFLTVGFLGITHVIPSFKVFKRDKLVGLVSPGVMFLRTCVYFLGLLGGLKKIFVKKG